MRFDRLKKKYNINPYLIAAFLFVFFIMFTLNSYTTFVADDFNNMYTSDSYKIKGISDIIQTQKLRYANTNGRTVAHFWGELILLFSKGKVDIINSLGFCLFIFLIYRFIEIPRNFLDSLQLDSEVGRRVEYLTEKKKVSALMYILVFFIIWYFTPVFGQDFLWVIGSANYMWTSILLLIVLIYTRKGSILNKGTKNAFISSMMLVISFLAGWTNENSVPAVLFIMVYQLIKMYIDDIGGKFMHLLTILSMVMGFLVMISAPGNFVRATYFKEVDDVFLRYTARLIKMNEKFMDYIFVFMIITLSFVILSRVLNLKKNIESEVFFAAGIIAFYTMILSPTFPPRAMISTIYLFAIAIVNSISNIGKFNIKTAYIVLAGLLLFTGVEFKNTIFSAMSANKEYMSKYYAREMIIIDSRSRGIVKEIPVPALSTDNKYVAAYGLGDCQKDPNDWINIAISRYYQVESVVLR